MNKFFSVLQLLLAVLAAALAVATLVNLVLIKLVEYLMDMESTGYQDSMILLKGLSIMMVGLLKIKMIEVLVKIF